MIIRQLKQDQYEYLQHSLMKTAHAEPLDVSYTVGMTVNGVEYAVKMQPEKHCKMAVLQALRIDRDGTGPHFELITKGSLLGSFLEILIYQGICQW
ncbi:hypothetical protein SAMN02745823_03584 [Sporobacter termitidis DSM 10068]|uniref:Uncharacterized protein n=1 Tax=Sporobacter termitidis DSM 10068 TaxID=1123282 RepID=A0A1M5ZDR6_9FIRM|nr:hypothetical protein [Sporobacter termitidis]SHI22314.1 hypothetical protein SAMN02745823_03584 [Sporobacter termitidis DSM 10068]